MSSGKEVKEAGGKGQEAGGICANANEPGFKPPPSRSFGGLEFDGVVREAPPRVASSKFQPPAPIQFS
ncbi:hypothetical protein [Nostoc sp.]|uniref:hypothetical protein n=1 Tax=Nostoc sp. TaxID=1180 RepID=UPI002FF9BC81